MDPLTRGDPTSPLRWTCKSRAQLTAALTAEGWRVSSSAVGRLLHALGYRLQALRKTREGQQHPDRNAQFEHINATAATFLRRGQPVISVDTKKKELVGDFKNAGREWQPTQTPEHVQVHDFPTQAAGRRSRTASTTWRATRLGSASAATTTRRPSRSPPFGNGGSMMGRAAYPTARHLLITADAGGSNGYRTRAWKTELQRLADDLQLRITVCHFPPGTSKWNKIEHRLFCHITTNWRGRALRTFETIVDLIGHTSTATGLRVRAKLDKRRYRTGVKVTAAEMRDVALHRHESPSLKDFMALTSYWRWMGTTQRLDGPDTSGDKTADILAVMTGRANERIVQTEQDWQRPWQRFARTPTGNCATP